MTRTEAAHVKCCVTCRHWHNNGKLASSYGDCAKGHPCNQGTCSHYCQDHEYANITDLPRYALPHLPPAFAAVRRQAGAPAKQVPPGQVPADRQGTAARRTVRKATCAECGATATDTCARCLKRLCGKHAFLSWVDGNNAAITKAAPIVCRYCHPDAPKHMEDVTRPLRPQAVPATEPNRKDATPATGCNP